MKCNLIALVVQYVYVPFTLAVLHGLFYFVRQSVTVLLNVVRNSSIIFCLDYERKSLIEELIFSSFLAKKVARFEGGGGGNSARLFFLSEGGKKNISYTILFVHFSCMISMREYYRGKFCHWLSIYKNVFYWFEPISTANKKQQK